MEGLDNLPPWLQALVSISVFLGTAGWAIFGYTKKRIGERLDSQESKDTVVISAAFADRAVIEKLDRRIDDLADAVQELRRSTERNTSAVDNQTGVMADRLNRIGDLLAAQRRL
jgi:hypothetical protein